MNNPRNLAWRLNWYRQSELEGALLLGRAVRAATDPKLVLSLTRHCADEARHSFQFTKTLMDLNLPIIQIFKSYQSLYSAHAGVPTSLTQMLAFTHIFEKRVEMQFQAELQTPDLPDAATRTFQTLLNDEQDHLAWVADWLASQPEAPAMLDHYRAVDQAVFQEIQLFSKRIWDVPGLGREPQDALFVLST
jgi:hypothetical protein